ncbi:MAG: C39 family peptidase [Allosphingosinicella sp.]
MFGDPRGGGDFSIPIRSMEDLRFDTVVRQRYDFSCGSAALATLLHYHYGVPTDEEAAFRGMWREGDRDQIRRLGFSLLDMKRYLAAQGYQADGYQVTLDEIERSGVPGIVLLNLGGYRHFVVVKGVQGDEVLVGDPALGMRTLSRAEFTETWAGVYFVLNSELDRGRATFGAPAQWAAYRRGPADGFFNEPMSQQALALSAPFLTDF